MLFQETKLGNLKVKNHFVRSATWEAMASVDGHMTPDLYTIYETLAKEEVGTIITGYANIVQEEQPNANMMGIYNDSFIPEYKQLCDLVHKYDSKIILQLAYGGTKTTYQTQDRIIFAPSAVAEKSTGVVGSEMRVEDIAYLVDAFAKSAKRAQLAGFDGVEIHGAHTYLINQFLSPYYNRREDAYGGSLENRMRFLLEIYDATRKQVGDDFTIGVKLTCTDFFEEGLHFDETKTICKRLEELGIDFIEISGNIHGKANTMVGTTFDEHTIVEEGYFLQYAQSIARLVDVDIITVGGFSNYETIEAIYNQKEISFFAFSRPLLSEPNLFSRWKQGDLASVKCIRCSKCRTKQGNYCVVFNPLK